jgi:hypothetical protein
MYSAVLAHQITDSLKYVLQHDYGYSEAGSAVSAGTHTHWYGINQYLTYYLNDEVSLGARVEWFRDDDGARVLGVRSGAGGGAADYYAFTVGANYNPCPYLRVRPEVRFDYQDQNSPDVAEAFDKGASNRQVTAAVDVIISF